MSVGKNNGRRGYIEEVAVAKIVNGTRSPKLGKAVADVTTGEEGLCIAERRIDLRNVVIECKSRKQPTPALVKQAWGQALAAHLETGKPPFVVLSFVDGGKRTRWLLTQLSESPSPITGSSSGSSVRRKRASGVSGSRHVSSARSATSPSRSMVNVTSGRLA